MIRIHTHEVALKDIPKGMHYTLIKQEGKLVILEIGKDDYGMLVKSKVPMLREVGDGQPKEWAQHLCSIVADSLYYEVTYTNSYEALRQVMRFYTRNPQGIKGYLLKQRLGVN